MKEITLLLPEALDFDERQTRRFLAAKLYESGKLSLGQAADMAGLFR
jgi:predicted HTH domain antitoxin